MNRGNGYGVCGHAAAHWLQSRGRPLLPAFLLNGIIAYCRALLIAKQSMMTWRPSRIAWRIGEAGRPFEPHAAGERRSGVQGAWRPRMVFSGVIRPDRKRGARRKRTCLSLSGTVPWLRHLVAPFSEQWYYITISLDDGWTDILFYHTMVKMTLLIIVPGHECH
jgi:hypothetical protein